jgi:hypothetical protein
MRTFLGLIFGILITVAGAYAHDNYVRRDAGEKTMVNWDVVRANVDGVQTSLRQMVSRLESK